MSPIVGSWARFRYRQAMSAHLFDRLRELNLPINGYAIFGSGPLAIRGIISSCSDLDILCGMELWDTVSQIGISEFLPEYDVTVVTLPDLAITFGLKWGIGDFDVAELIETAEIIDALPFVRLEHVIAYKTIRSSEKDVLHLDALRSSGYLE